MKRVALDADKGQEGIILNASLEGGYPRNEQLSLNAVLAATTAREDGADDTIELGVGARFTPQEQLIIGGVGCGCFTDVYDGGAQLAAGVEF